MQRFLDFKESFLSLVTDRHEWLASRFTDLFHSAWPYGVILGVSLLTVLLVFVDDRKWRTNHLGVILLRFVSVAFPATMLLMQMVLLTLGRTGCTWWCNPYRLGGWQGLLRIGMFLLFLLVQWSAAFVYVFLKHETIDDEDEKWSNIVFSPLFFSLVIFYPVGSWVIYHVGGWIHLPGIVGIVLWLLIPIAGLVFTWLANSGSFGFSRGTLFTLLSVCIAVGLMAGLCCLIESISMLYHYVPIWKLSLLLVLTIICFALLAYNEKDGGTTSDGTKIIFYWFENPGGSGAVLALILGYLVGHFWFHWF